MRVCRTSFLLFFFTEAGVGITIRSQTLSVPMSILGVCAQWHSQFSNILVVCADRWTRIGFKSVTKYTGRPAFSVQFFKQQKKKAPRCFTLSVSCSLTGLKSAQSVRMTKLNHSAGGKRRSSFPPQDRKGQSLLMQRFSCATTVSKSDMKRLLQSTLLGQCGRAAGVTSCFSRRPRLGCVHSVELRIPPRVTAGCSRSFTTSAAVRAGAPRRSMGLLGDGGSAHACNVDYERATKTVKKKKKNRRRRFGLALVTDT